MSTLNIMWLIKTNVVHPISQKQKVKSTTISINKFNIVQLFEIYLAFFTYYFIIFYHNALRRHAFLSAFNNHPCILFICQSSYFAIPLIEGNNNMGGNNKCYAVNKKSVISLKKN